MRFKTFKFECIKEKDGIKRIKELDAKKLYDLFTKFPIKYDNDNSQYTVMYSSFQEHIILGTLVQSYFIELSKFDSKTKSEQLIPESQANDKTYFFIDTKEGILYVQNRRYQQENLNMGKTILRLESILNQILSPIYEGKIKIYQTKVEYSVDEFWHFFKNSNVKYLRVKNIQGIELPKGTVLHNPREDLDEALCDSWNTYSKDNVDELELKASNGKTLKKNPIAAIGLVLAKVGNDNGKDIINKMEINDSEGEVVLKPKDNEYKVINISNEAQKDPHKTYEKILVSMLPNYVSND